MRRKQSSATLSKHSCSKSKYRTDEHINNSLLDDSECAAQTLGSYRSRFEKWNRFCVTKNEEKIHFKLFKYKNEMSEKKSDEKSHVCANSSKKKKSFFLLKLFRAGREWTIREKKTCAIYHFYTERWVSAWIKNWTQQAAWTIFEYFRCSLICSQSEIDRNMEVWSWDSQIWRHTEREKKTHTKYK